MTENTDNPNRNSRTSDWPTLYGIQSLCHKKTVNALSLSYQTFFILFLVFLCKKILGYGGEQLVDYGSDKVAKFHITEPETIMDGVQKILKTMFHILYSFYLYLSTINPVNSKRSHIAATKNNHLYAFKPYFNSTRKVSLV
ncbi:MAG: hypothetical protein ACOCOB_07710, partial [Prevotella sp.]